MFLKTVLFAVLSVVLAINASASPIVYLNVPSSSLFDVEGVWTARNRMSRAGSVDQMLFEQPNPAGFPAADLFALNNTFTGTVTYNFLVKNTPTLSGSKITFTLSSGSANGGVTFVGGGANNTLEYTFDDEYNILHIYGQTTTPNSSLRLSNMVFSSNSLITSGSLVPLASISQVSGTTAYNQYVATDEDTDLGLYDWTISGVASLGINGTNPNSGEGIKWEISGKEGCVIFVPEPAFNIAIPLFLIGACFLYSLCGCKQCK